jgi:hypothetical protein
MPIAAWRKWLAAAGAVLALQAGFYAFAPALTGEPLRDLTRRWKIDYAPTRSLGIALDAKRAGWCRLYAGNRGIAPTESADFLIVEDADLPRHTGWEVVATATRTTSVKFSQGGLSAARQAFHLLRRREM